MDRWGAIDILVANIGSGTGRSGWALDEHEWEASFELNLHASRRAVDAILPHMTRAGRGSVVFISSIVSLEV